jgi:hypothetical protein
MESMREAAGDLGLDRLLERVRPRWDRERHERVFAAIVERIRREDDAQRQDRSVARRLRLRHV